MCHVWIVKNFYFYFFPLFKKNYVGRQGCFAHGSHWILHFCNFWNFYLIAFFQVWFFKLLGPWSYDLINSSIHVSNLKYNNFIIWYLKPMKLFNYFMGSMHLFLVSPFRINIWILVYYCNFHNLKQIFFHNYFNILLWIQVFLFFIWICLHFKWCFFK
jgi:hypothetical protein